MSKLMFGFALLFIGCTNVRADVQCPPGDVAAVRERVQAALHADPYFYDEHVTVAAENDSIVLHGYVFSAWDVQDALRIGTRAVCNRRLINDLSIVIERRH